MHWDEVGKSKRVWKHVNLGWDVDLAVSLVVSKRCSDRMHAQNSRTIQLHSDELKFEEIQLNSNGLKFLDSPIELK